MIQFIIVGALFSLAIFYILKSARKAVKANNCGEGNCGCK